MTAHSKGFSNAGILENQVVGQLFISYSILRNLSEFDKEYYQNMCQQSHTNLSIIDKKV